MEPRTTRCAVLGTGPIGLEAALYAATLGMDVTVYEQGEEIAANVRDWGHVTMFSPFGMNCSSLGAGLLAEVGHALPEDEAYQSGMEYVETYLRPLAELSLLEGRIQLGARAVSLGKDGLAKGDLIGQKARLEKPFRLFVQGSDGADGSAAPMSYSTARACTTTPTGWATAAFRPSASASYASASRIVCPTCSEASARTMRARRRCSWAMGIRRRRRYSAF